MTATASPQNVRTILHPTDFSATAAKALAVACSLARDQSARLVLLHVLPKASARPWNAEMSTGYRADHIEEDVQEYANEMKRKLDRMVLPDAKLSVERRVVEGDVPLAIVAAAEDTCCDLIVLGMRDACKAGKSLKDNTVNGILHDAPCPVVTVSEGPAKSQE